MYIKQSQNSYVTDDVHLPQRVEMASFELAYRQIKTPKIRNTKKRNYDIVVDDSTYEFDGNYRV
jgi:hypothetical protein